MGAWIVAGNGLVVTATNHQAVLYDDRTNGHLARQGRLTRERERLARTTNRDTQAVLPHEVAAAVGSWMVGGGHKTVAAYVSRWLAPAVPEVAEWWSEVTTFPVAPGALAALPNGGSIAYRR